MRLISFSPAKYLLLLSLLAGVALLASACGPGITVNRVEPIENVLETQTLQLSNCDCDTELVSGVEMQKELNIDDYAYTGSQDKRILIPAETRTELETELELVYEPLYEMAKTAAGQIQLTVPADKIRNFKIEWTQQTYSSTISFRKGLRTYTTEYTYELRLPRETGFIEISCVP
jgi:hypothetical protein